MGMAVDVSRSRRDLIIENAVLRHQINILRRGKKRPRLGVTDRLKLLLGASLLPAWRQAIAIVQPDTLLRWHRAGFRLFWRLRSRPRRGSPLAKETIDLSIRCTDPVWNMSFEFGNLVAWNEIPNQRAGICFSGGSAGGMVKGPTSLASSTGSRRARVAAQYLGASSR